MTMVTRLELCQAEGQLYSSFVRPLVVASCRLHKITRLPLVRPWHILFQDAASQAMGGRAGNSAEKPVMDYGWLIGHLWQVLIAADNTHFQATTLWTTFLDATEGTKGCLKMP